jgi:hypothetical protein
LVLGAFGRPGARIPGGGEGTDEPTSYETRALGVFSILATLAALLALAPVAHATPPASLTVTVSAGFIGGNIYNTTAVNQTIAVTRAPGRTATFTVRIQNDGAVTDEILVDGTRAATGFTMVVTRNGTNVTNAFVAGTLGVTLDPGTRQDLVVRITVKATTRSGKVDRETVLLTSMNDLAGKDAVRAKVTVRSYQPRYVYVRCRAIVSRRGLGDRRADDAARESEDTVRASFTILPRDTTGR